jgi:hypothetical protein
MLLYKRRIFFLLIWLFCLDDYGCHASDSDEGSVSSLFLNFSKTCISESSELSISWSSTVLVSSVLVCLLLLLPFLRVSQWWLPFSC